VKSRLLVLAFLTAVFSLRAGAELCDNSKHFCGYMHGAAPSSGAPTHGSKLRINPSAVPTEKTLGLEGIYYSGSIDFALVKGLGRVGAAISPSNSDETFFGPPAIETSEDLFERKDDRRKYPQQKITLATAFNLFSNRSSGLKRFELNLGAMGKYNRRTHDVLPGGGVSGIAGPLTFGYSIYRDQTQLNDAPADQEESRTIVNSNVQTYSVGVYLNSVALDYSFLRTQTTDDDVSTVSVTTGTLMIQRTLTTLAVRQEKSDRLAYNYSTRTLEVKEKKNEIFGGFQFAITKHLMIGGFYNYYLLHEVSAGAILFL
jgi:hypothetical protein